MYVNIQLKVQKTKCWKVYKIIKWQNLSCAIISLSVLLQFWRCVIIYMSLITARRPLSTGFQYKLSHSFWCYKRCESNSFQHKCLCKIYHNFTKHSNRMMSLYNKWNRWLLGHIWLLIIYHHERHPISMVDTSKSSIPFV